MQEGFEVMTSQGGGGTSAENLVIFTGSVATLTQWVHLQAKHDCWDKQRWEIHHLKMWGWTCFFFALKHSLEVAVRKNSIFFYIYQHNIFTHVKLNMRSSVRWHEMKNIVWKVRIWFAILFEQREFMNTVWNTLVCISVCSEINRNFFQVFDLTPEEKPLNGSYRGKKKHIAFKFFNWILKKGFILKQIAYVDNYKTGSPSV